MIQPSIVKLGFEYRVWEPGVNCKVCWPDRRECVNSLGWGSVHVPPARETRG